MNFFDLLSARRSVRQYTEEPIERNKLQQIVAAGLMTPSSKNLHSTEFLVVEDRSLISQMARCKPRFGEMLTQATAAVVVLGRLESHAWVEDASLAMLAMMLEARELGIGSCWVQVRHMVSEKIGSDGNPLTSNKDLQELLHFPDGLEVEAILSLGSGSIGASGSRAVSSCCLGSRKKGTQRIDMDKRQDLYVWNVRCRSCFFVVFCPFPRDF